MARAGRPEPARMGDEPLDPARPCYATTTAGLAPLVANAWLGEAVAIDVTLNRLDLASVEVLGDIATLEARGALLSYEPQRD
jgi:hypothetical protein